jgi:hypothetical protein
VHLFIVLSGQRASCLGKRKKCNQEKSVVSNLINYSQLFGNSEEEEALEPDNSEKMGNISIYTIELK